MGALPFVFQRRQARTTRLSRACSNFQRSIPGWVGSWRLRRRGVDYAGGIKGINYDEAFRDIVRGVLRVASGHGAPK